MENRRHHYRQSFTSARFLRVTLTTNMDSLSIMGVMVNLSIGGMCIETADARIATSERWNAAFTLDSESLTMPVERVYAQQEARACYGFRFMPPTNLNIREAQEKAIWKFLLEHQRSERRQKLEVARLAG